jgi:hypothetical protein
MMRYALIAGLLLTAQLADGQEKKETGRGREATPARLLPREGIPSQRLLAPDRASTAVQKEKPAYQPLIDQVQEGLSTGAVELFTHRMAPQVYVNLRGGENGYFSGNQAHYLLVDYLRNRRMVNLRFSTVGESKDTPYATGSATIVERGTRGIVQVYISLIRAGEDWNVTQIAIY